MSKAENILLQMRNNPRGDWHIEDFKTVAKRHGIEWRQPGTSHVIFKAPNGDKVSVPAHKPIKPPYVRQFLAMIDRLRD